MTEITQDSTIDIEEERLQAIASPTARVIAKKFIRKTHKALLRNERSAGDFIRPRYFDIIVDATARQDVINAIEMIMFTVPFAVGGERYARKKYFVVRWIEHRDHFVINPAYVE